MMTAATMLFASSCSKEQISTTVPVGEEVAVTLTADLGAIESRTSVIADGKKVNEVAWAIYLHGSTTPLPDFQGVLPINGKEGKLEVRLVTGRSYDIALFAYHTENPTDKQVNIATPAPKYYVVDWSNNLVAVQYPNGPIANDEDARDCFWFVKENLEVNAPINETFELHRPLAQLNFGVTAQDTADAAAAGLVVSQSKIVASTYTQFDVLTGKCTGELVEYTFAQNKVPTQELTVSDVDYTYIGTAYLLVNDGEPLKDNVSITIYDEDNNTTAVNTLSYDNVPFKRNYRTNILGALLTNPAEFTVKVDERFDGDLTPGSNNTPSILPAQDVVEFGAEGGDTSVALTLTNITENVTYTVSDYNVINKVNVENGVLYITVNENTSSESRTATITLKANGAEATITVQQEGKAVEKTTITVADFLAMEEDDTVEYVLSGTITAVANTTYGNFDLTDDTGTVLIYGLMSPDGETNKYWATSGAKLGDDIVVKTIRTSFNGTPQGKNAKFVELVSPGTRAFYTVDPTSIEFASAGGEEVVIVTRYNTDATVSATSDNDVFSVSVNDNEVTISAAANELEEKIEGAVTIKVGDLASTEVKVILAAKPAAGNIEGGSDDFHTISATNTSYVSGKTTAGWNYKNCAIFKGGTSDSSPAFKMIGDSSNRALCMNGKTSAVGTITSPTLTTGCGTLKFNYGLPFSDTKIKFRVDIMQNGAVVKTFTINNASASKVTKYSHEETINVAGEFQIVFTNLSPSNSTSNKDRTAIWDVEWTGYSAN